MNAESISYKEFTEETRYVVECPSCGNMIESDEDPSIIRVVICDNCESVFNVLD